MNKYKKAFDKVTEACVSYDTVDELIDLKELVDKFQWIPCDKRLPDRNGNYLVTRAFRDGYGYVMIDHFNYDLNQTWMNDTSPYAKDKCVAWMYVPKPYGGSEDEE
jgi:hypothetical protein